MAGGECANCCYPPYATRHTGAGRIRWWVAAKDFGSGPFRRVVGEAASPPFNLPAGAEQVVRIDLTTPPN